MQFGISSSGGAGDEPGSWNGWSLTTNATANTEDSTDLGQPIFNSLIVNDSDTDIVVGFGITTATKSFTIKPGEGVIVDLVYRTLYYKSSGTSKAFRILAIW